MINNLIATDVTYRTVKKKSGTSSFSVEFLPSLKREKASRTQPQNFKPSKSETKKLLAPILLSSLLLSSSASSALPFPPTSFSRKALEKKKKKCSDRHQYYPFLRNLRRRRTTPQEEEKRRASDWLRIFLKNLRVKPPTHLKL